MSGSRIRGATSRTSGPRTAEDPTGQRIVGFLRAQDADRIDHGGPQSLLDHLIGTYEIVRRWNQPERFQHAALIHSVYGTDRYHPQLLPLSSRNDLINVAGDQAERLAYLFCVTPRKLVFAGTHLWTRTVPTSSANTERSAVDQQPATRDELDGLVLVHMANLAQQARASDGAPGQWLVRLRELAELLIGSEVVTLPLFIARLAAFSEADESVTRHAYRAGIAELDDLEARASWLGLAAAVCPVVPEPCVWLAHLWWCRQDHQAARRWAQCARRRLVDLGTTWDKRLTFDQWLELTHLLEQPTGRERPAVARVVADPITLFEIARPDHVEGDYAPRGPISNDHPVAPPDAAAGRKRFHRYVEQFADGDDRPWRAPYPDLESEPWYDATAFPLARYLQSHFEAIREEILGLDYSIYQPESERIERSGDWDVAFLYERGLRHDELCKALSVTTRGIEIHPAMRTVAGLIYVSRMRSGTHIRAHRGPTNLRVRCHLGIKVPRGDCAIRVGDQIRHWREGQCLVFDDSFEHEAWNHTARDRIVLVVDMWHPGLSSIELGLLEGLHGYAYGYARQLDRYWSTNAAAALKPISPSRSDSGDGRTPRGPSGEA
jgi:Aspartyl/Asparaginyl beta-hydroxylase